MDDPAVILARADLARFLSACYYEPGPAFTEEKLFDSMRAVGGVIDPAFGAAAGRLGEAFSGESQEALLLDYTRLFLGPNEVVARPYGSVWLEDARTLMGSTTVKVIELYRRGGFDLDESFRELPDHIACELEFLYLLLFREGRGKAAANGEQRGADEVPSEARVDTSRLRRRLLADHLGRWVAPFTAAVGAGAGTQFYRELAALTDRFVRSEVDQAR